jgi:uncharacterized OB-fold protein
MRKRCRKSGKVKFPSHESAAKRAGEILQKSKVKELGTYLCTDCGKWHLTSRTWVQDEEAGFWLRGFRMGQVSAD